MLFVFVFTSCVRVESCFLTHKTGLLAVRVLVCRRPRFKEAALAGGCFTEGQAGLPPCSGEGVSAAFIYAVRHEARAAVPSEGLSGRCFVDNRMLIVGA